MAIYGVTGRKVANGGYDPNVSNRGNFHASSLVIPQSIKDAAATFTKGELVGSTLMDSKETGIVTSVDTAQGRVSVSYNGAKPLSCNPQSLYKKELKK